MKTLPEVLDAALYKNKVNENEASAILMHLAEIHSQKGIRESSMIARAKDLISSSRFIHEVGGELHHCNTEQVLKAVSKIRTAGFTTNTERMTIASLKRFLIWQIENGTEDLNLNKIKKIKVPKMDFNAKKREDLLTYDEVQVVIDACRNSRDRAIIALLYDGSNRPVEIKNLLWADVTFDDYGIRIRTSEKTGNERWIRLTLAVSYLSTWRQDYSAMIDHEIQPNDPVFIALIRDDKGNPRPINYSTLNNLILTLRERTGIKKLRPGIFRPTKITHDVENGYDPAYIMMKNWGSLSTRMLAVYAKPGSEYIDKVALEKAGLKRQETSSFRKDILKPIQCPICNTLNPGSADYCIKCGRSMTERAAVIQEDLIEKLRTIAKERPEELIEAIKKL